MPSIHCVHDMSKRNSLTCAVIFTKSMLMRKCVEQFMLRVRRRAGQNRLSPISPAKDYTSLVCLHFVSTNVCEEICQLRLVSFQIILCSVHPIARITPAGILYQPTMWGGCSFQLSTQTRKLPPEKNKNWKVSWVSQSYPTKHWIEGSWDQNMKEDIFHLRAVIDIFISDNIIQRSYFIYSMHWVFIRFHLSIIVPLLFAEDNHWYGHY